MQRKRDKTHRLNADLEIVFEIVKIFEGGFNERNVGCWVDEIWKMRENVFGFGWFYIVRKRKEFVK